MCAKLNFKSQIHTPHLQKSQFPQRQQGAGIIDVTPLFYYVGYIILIYWLGDVFFWHYLVVYGIGYGGGMWFYG